MALDNRILAVINPASEQQLALEKALGIARVTGGEVTALLRSKHANEQLIATIEQQLSIASQAGMVTQLEISKETHLFNAIANCLRQYDIGLITKQPDAALTNESLFAPVDWKLLRYVRCPMLMVRDSTTWTGQPVVLAVDANPRDSQHSALNTRIIETAKTIQAYADCNLHLMTAYPSEMQDSHDTNQQSESAQCQKYRVECARLVDQFSLQLQATHLESGPAELIIPDKAKAIGAKLVIMGTVARAGLQGMLLGNTAEQILPKLDASLLVLPPN